MFPGTPVTSNTLSHPLSFECRFETTIITVLLTVGERAPVERPAPSGATPLGDGQPRPVATVPPRRLAVDMFRVSLRGMVRWSLKS